MYVKLLSYVVLGIFLTQVGVAQDEATSKPTTDPAADVGEDGQKTLPVSGNPGGSPNKKLDPGVIEQNAPNTNPVTTVPSSVSTQLQVTTSQTADGQSTTTIETVKPAVTKRWSAGLINFSYTSSVDANRGFETRQNTNEGYLLVGYKLGKDARHSLSLRPQYMFNAFDVTESFKWLDPFINYSPGAIIKWTESTKTAATGRLYFGVSPTSVEQKNPGKFRGYLSTSGPVAGKLSWGHTLYYDSGSISKTKYQKTKMKDGQSVTETVDFKETLYNALSLSYELAPKVTLAGSLGSYTKWAKEKNITQLDVPGNEWELTSSVSYAPMSTLSFDFGIMQYRKHANPEVAKLTLYNENESYYYVATMIML